MDARIASRRHDRLPRERRGGADREHRSARRGVPSRRRSRASAGRSAPSTRSSRSIRAPAGGAVLGPARHRDACCASWPSASAGSRSEENGRTIALAARQGVDHARARRSGRALRRAVPHAARDARGAGDARARAGRPSAASSASPSSASACQPVSTLDEIEWVPKQRYAHHARLHAPGRARSVIA